MISSIVALDTAVLSALYAIRDPFLVQAFIWISELARVPTVVGFTAIAVILLAYRKRWALASGLMTSALGGGAAALFLKEVIARARPEKEFAAYMETSYSFPSGHATLVVALYGFLVWMLWDMIPAQWRKAAIAALGCLIFLIGFSRLYLGVHYLSDVLGGYLVGGFSLWIGTKFVRKLRRS